MADNTTIVRMDETDPDSIITAAMAERYAMPAVVVAAMKQAGKHISIKLLKLVESEKFDTLPINTQLRLAEFIFDRAFGKAESAAVSIALNHKINPQITTSSDSSSRLRAIESRRQFPEMRKTRSASKVPASGSESDGGEAPSDRVSLSDSAHGGGRERRPCSTDASLAGATCTRARSLFFEDAEVVDAPQSAEVIDMPKYIAMRDKKSA